MIVGPDHPIFGDRDGCRGEDESRRRWGSDGLLPQMGALPSARHDPIVPFSHIGGGVWPLAQFPRREYSGDPDNDEFMPP